MDRRGFFRQALRGLVRTVAETVEASVKPEHPGSAAVRLLRRVRPPGALPEKEFLAKCTSCGDCIEVCPAQCITKVPEGASDGGTPVIVPASRACVLCSGLQCTQVCEPGALLPLERMDQVAMGVAVLDPSVCMPYQGLACEVCVEVCPTEPPAIEVVDGLPRVRAELCVGCGLCEERCPTRPRAIQVTPSVAAGAQGGG